MPFFEINTVIIALINVVNYNFQPRKILTEINKVIITFIAILISSPFKYQLEHESLTNCIESIGNLPGYNYYNILVIWTLSSVMDIVFIILQPGTICMDFVTVN